MRQELRTALEASIEAGEEIMRIYENENFQIESKGDDSPLTIADKRANDIIIGFLDNTGIPVISEENKQVSYDERKKWSECWIVDPLDGTKEFIKKNGEFTVNIALVKDGKPLLGVIYVPVSKIAYFADVEKSTAYKIKIGNKNDLDSLLSGAEKLQPISTEGSIRVVGSRSHMSEETFEYINSLKNRYHREVEMVPKGSSLKFCLVAEGLADVYPRFAPTMEWDTAAGQAICEAVGLQVIDKKTLEPMVYNRENLLNHHFLVSNLG